MRTTKRLLVAILTLGFASQTIGSDIPFRSYAEFVTSTLPCRGTLGGVRFDGRQLHQYGVFIAYRVSTAADSLPIGKYGEYELIGSYNGSAAAGPAPTIVTAIVLRRQARSTGDTTRYLAFPVHFYKDLSNPTLGEDVVDWSMPMFISGDRLGLQMSGGDGADGYDVAWEVDTRQLLVRRLIFEDTSFAENIPWQPLVPIEAPEITFDP